MWGRRGHTIEARAELEDISKAAEYGGHLIYAGADDEGALRLRRGRILEGGAAGDDIAGSIKVLEYARGDTYEGQVFQGLKHGKGTYVWGNGAKYDGDWRENVPSGMGKYTWPDGESYEGGFKHGRREGSGIYTFCDGASFVGVFHDDQPRGKGVCTLPGGRCFHGEYSLFQAYLRATRERRGRKAGVGETPGDPWVHEKWPESADMLRNPPWDGFSAVRPGHRHYEEGFSVFRNKRDAPPVAIKEWAVDWPHPLNSVSSLDLETGHGRRHVPKRMMAEWPRGRAPPREEEEEEEVVEEEGVREWKVGDVCECLDVVGAPLASLGRTELGGKLVPKKPGMYFKVRLDAVENVWPGFTSDDFPLVICKVTYIGMGTEKPQEWVQASRLRPAMAVRNENVAEWQGWAVRDGDGGGPVGEYKSASFVPYENVIHQGDIVECLFPFTGQTRQGRKRRVEEDIVYPRMLELAAKSAIEVMLSEGDPTCNGMWLAATPYTLQRLPWMLIFAGRWEELGGRVLASLSFVSQVNLELGPDFLCDLLDMARAGIDSAPPDEVPPEAEAAVREHREFAYTNRQRLRVEPLPVVAARKGLRSQELLENVMLGQTGMLQLCETYMQEAVPGASCDLLLLAQTKAAIELCLRLGMLSRDQLLVAREDILLFLEANEPAPMQLAELRKDCRSRGEAYDPKLPPKASIHAVHHELSMVFSGVAKPPKKPIVMRIKLAMRYDPSENQFVRMRIIQLLSGHKTVSDGGRVVVLRVCAGCTRDSNEDRDVTEVLVGVWVPKGRDARDAVLDMTNDFNTHASDFSGKCRSLFAVSGMCLMEQSTFISLVLAPRPPPTERQAEQSLSFAGTRRGRGDGDEEEDLFDGWEAQRIRNDLSDALGLPREAVKVLELGACRSRCVIELACAYGQAPPDTVYKLAKNLADKVMSGESVFEGGKVVDLYEYALSAVVNKGWSPPSLPGEWRSVGVWASVMGGDVQCEAHALANMALPTLRKVMLSSRVCLTWSAPGINGISNTSKPTQAGRRLTLMRRHGIPLPGGDRIPFTVGVMSEGRVGAPVEGTCWIIEGHEVIGLRVWAGDVSESKHMPRGAGWVMPESKAVVRLPLGEVTLSQFCASLQITLTGAKWEGAGAPPPSQRGGNPWHWKVSGVNGRVNITLTGEKFYRFELDFKSISLAAMAGFSAASMGGADGSSAVPSPEGGLIVTGGSPVLVGKPGLWVCELLANGLWQESEEVEKCVSAGFAFSREWPWKEGGYGSMELAYGACVRPRGGETAVYVRRGGFEVGRQWTNGVKDGGVPTSATIGILPGDDESGVASEVMSIVRRSGAVVKEIEGLYEEYEYQGDAIAMRFWASHRAAEELEEARVIGREAKREEWRKARVAAGIVASSDQKIKETEYGEELMEGGEGWRRVQMQREECVCWWLLLEEEVKFCRKSGCHHGNEFMSCRQLPCKGVREAYIHGEENNVKDWIDDLKALGRDPSAPIPSLSSIGARFECDEIEAESCRDLHATLSTLLLMDDPTKLPEPSRPYHSHLLERASHDLQSRSLSKGYAAPYGGSRDAVNAHLERVTSGPPSSRPPVVLITGPPHSGRSSCLAYFDRRSVRCGASRRVDHSITSSPVFPHGPEGVIVRVFLDEGSDSSRRAFEFAATEVSLQVNRGEGLGGEEDANSRMGDLMSVSKEDLEEGARARFAACLSSALRDGVNILLLIDGLDEKGLTAFSEQVASLHSEVAERLRFARGRGEIDAACIQCVLTCGASAPKGEIYREIAVPFLGESEKRAIASSSLPPSVLNAATLDAVCSVEGAGLPRVLIAACHEATRFSLLDNGHSTQDSSGRIRRENAVCQHIASMPGSSLVSFLVGGVLPQLEKEHGRTTVQWVMLHLALLGGMGGGVPIHDLRSHVRSSLGPRHLVMSDVIAKGADKLVLLIPLDEAFDSHRPREERIAQLVDCETGELLWNRARGGEIKDLEKMLSYCRPMHGQVWCSDAELDAILFAVAPYLRHGPGAASLSTLGGAVGEVVAMTSSEVRAAVVFRYDNPGSILVKAEKPDSNPLDEQESRTVAIFNQPSFRDVLRVPLTSPPPPAGLKTALKLTASAGAGPDPPSAPQALPLVLPYEQSAIRGEDVVNFFRSLDDNCVWHLHHLDQVMCLFPGGSVHVSRARFRPRIVKRETILQRFAVERDLLCLYSGRAKVDGGGMSGEDLARRGYKLTLKGVREGVHLGEACMVCATDDIAGGHTHGTYGFGDGVEVDELAVKTSNFTARTGDFSREFSDDHVIGGYAMSIDMCVEGDDDAFPITGGAGKKQWDRYADIRVRMTPDPGSPGMHAYKLQKLYLERRGTEGMGPVVEEATLSWADMVKLPTPRCLIDFETKTAVWEAPQPWFGARIGRSYVLALPTGLGSPQARVCEACGGTCHPLGGGSESHFHYKEDFERAKEALNQKGFMTGVKEAMQGIEILSVMLTLSVEASESTWVGRGGAGVLYPPKEGVEMWCKSFRAGVSRGRWQALTISVDSTTGVLVCLEGRCVGQSPLPRGRKLRVSHSDASVCVGDSSCYGAFSGYFRNLAVYRRSLTLAEMQVMSTRGLSSKKKPKEIEGEGGSSSTKASAQGGKGSDAAKPPAKKKVDYVSVVQGDSPFGFWPLEELGTTIECLDRATNEDAGEAGGVAGNALLQSMGVSGGGGAAKGAAGGDGEVIVRNMLYEKKHKASVVKGKFGPKSIESDDGKFKSTSVMFQGGCIRGEEGGLCLTKEEPKDARGGMAPRKKLSTSWADLTFEVWIQRVSPFPNECETIASYNSELMPQPGAPWFFMDAKGRLNFHIEGEARAVGPCPEAAITDLEWHHVVVSRTSDPDEVNNWTFYVDGKRVWTTRHDGIPIASPAGCLMLGKRHGEFWGASRQWRAGVGDPSCLQANMYGFAFYPRALTLDEVSKHFQFSMAPAALPEPDASQVVAESRAVDGGGAVIPLDKPGEGRGPFDIADAGGTKGTISNAGSERAIVSRSRVNALQHRPLVWGKTPSMTPMDVGAFYGALENNPIWAMTKRSTSVTTSGPHHNIGVISSVSGGTLRTLPAPAGGKGGGGKIGEGHRLAAEALTAAGDPGGHGTWECASPSVLRGVVWHGMMGRAWCQLEKCICSLWFLSRCVQEFGVHATRDTLDSVAAAASRRQGDDAIACRDSALLHSQFLSDYVQAGSISGIWEAAGRANLPGVEDVAGRLGDAIHRIQTLISTPVALPSVIPAEISGARLRRLLETAQSLGIEVLCPSPKTVKTALDSLQEWMQSRSDASVGTQNLAKWLGDLAKYDDGAIAADNASVIMGEYARRHVKGSKCIRVRLGMPMPPQGSKERANAARDIMGSFPGCAIIRAEETYLDRTRHGNLEPGGGLFVLIASETFDLEAVSMPEAQFTLENELGSVFVCMWLRMGYAWGGSRQLFAQTLHMDAVAALEGTPGCVPHVASVSEGGGFCVVEVTGDAAWDAAGGMARQVGMSSSAMARGKASQYAVCAQVVRSRVVPSPGGGQEAAGVYVASSLIDFAAERRHLDRVLVPGLQALLRPSRVSLSCCDLRLGGAKQAFGQETAGLMGLIPALEGSTVGASRASPGGGLELPWVILLLGSGGSGGVSAGEPEAERVALRRTHPWTVGMAGASALELEATRALHSLTPPGLFPCIVSAVARGTLITQTDGFRRLLPESARSAFDQREGADVISRLRACCVDGLSKYEAKVLGYRCEVEVIISRVRELAEVLEEDSRAMRGWPDVGFGGGSEHRHGLSGIMRTRADDLTARQRKIVAERKAELMRWWLLLREEMERFKGATGLPKDPKEVHTLQELTRTANDPLFLSLLDPPPSGGGAGILDTDAYKCPAIGSPGVAALGADIDVGGFSVAFCESVLQRAMSVLPISPTGLASPMLPPPLPRFEWREMQFELVKRYAAAWVGDADCPTVGGSASATSIVPAHNLCIMMVDDQSKGIGVISKEGDRYNVHWQTGVKGTKKHTTETVWKESTKYEDPNGIDGAVRLLPPRTSALAEVERFTRQERKRPNSISSTDSNTACMLIVGEAGMGKSTLMARAVQTRISGLQAAPGIAPRQPTEDPSVASFYFAAGKESPAGAVMAWLADDIEAQIGAPPHPRASSSSSSSSLGEGRRRLAKALKSAASITADGAEFGLGCVIYVDGLLGADAEALCEAVAAIDREILSEVRRSMKRICGVRCVVSCAQPTARALKLSGNHVVRLEGLLQGEIMCLTRIEARRWGRVDAGQDFLSEVCKVEGMKCPLYITALCHAARNYREDGGVTPVLELPSTLVPLFVDGILRKMEVLHSRALVEILLVHLLCSPTGVPLAELKMIARRGMTTNQQSSSGSKLSGGASSLGRVGYADCELHAVLEALRPFLVPPVRSWEEGGEDRVWLEHRVLKDAAQLRYDPAARPLWGDEGIDKAASDNQRMAFEAEKKKKAQEVDIEGYAWVRARVFSPPDAGLALQVDYQVTYESAISVAPHHIWHVRRVIVPKPKGAKKAAVAEADTKDKGVTLSRPGWPVKVPKGLAQGFPFLDAGFEEDPSQRMLLSTAMHPDDDSHLRAGVERGFPAVPEKRYALTQYSAQAKSQGGRVKVQPPKDRWSSTGGLNPGPAFGTYPPKRESRPNLTRMPGAVRSLASNWGQPSSAPSIKELDDAPGGYGQEDSDGTATATSTAGTQGASGKVRSRTEGYASRRQKEIFGDPE